MEGLSNVIIDKPFLNLWPCLRLVSIQEWATIFDIARGVHGIQICSPRFRLCNSKYSRDKVKNISTTKIQLENLKLKNISTGEHTAKDKNPLHKKYELETQITVL